MDHPSVPYTKGKCKKVRMIALTVWAALAAASVAFSMPQLREVAADWDISLVALRWTTVILLPFQIPTLAACFARLYIAPEGIYVTVFGKRIRYFPAEKIRFLSGVRYTHKLDGIELIAVCDYSLEELTELGGVHLLPYANPPWEGAYANKYLERKASSIFREFNRNKRILWLDWDVELLKLLRRRYPNAQWLDTSKDGMFEQQLIL